ncbi:signal recognition particle receptor subunit beta [Catenulispora sp. EB89]|uniref:GTP-binding protein n=1 Tax=Catenulispora sp. EB89 TaxID=3156257 RepID=UPI0035125226
MASGASNRAPAADAAGISDAAGEPGLEPGLPTTTTVALKIAVVGPLGVGKTTFVTSVSDIAPLTTEEPMSGPAPAGAPPTKTTTTVAMDFGRISLDDRVVLYLFGTPGQERFWFLWDGLVEGALGAIVLVDVRRLEESFDVLERLEDRGVPFVVAANCFPDAPLYPVEDLRAAMDLPLSVPVVLCDARERSSCRDVLLDLSTYLLALTHPEPGVTPNTIR